MEPPTPPPPERKTEEAKAILDHLNTTAGRQYRPTPANLSLITARLKEVNGDVEGVKTMIDRQCANWLGDPKMDEFLRPSTLFRAGNFGNYYDNRDLPVVGRVGAGGAAPRPPAKAIKDMTDEELLKATL